MLKREKEVYQYLLDNEEAVIKALEKHYRDALHDINLSIRIMQSDELTQSKVYQIQYQEALKKQVEGILERMHAKEYTTIQQYLSDSYRDAFVGTMYSIHGQNVPLILPIDQNAAVKAVITDSHISEGLYEHLGIPVEFMKKTITAELTRGIASNMRFVDIARNIEYTTHAPLANAKNIVRTEGHRIQQASSHDARLASKNKGADVVKQWDATLDGATRRIHRELDGKIVEVDEYFKAGGAKALYPGDFGEAGLDCQCRCVALTRARWALDESELETLKERAEFFKLDKTEDFQDFKEKYLKAAETFTDADNKINVSAPTTKENGTPTVHHVGNINRSYFKAVSEDVTTDEVIITDERIAHSNLHKDAYEKYGAYMPSVLSDPDFAFRDKNPNTVVLIKRIDQDGKNLELVLRLHVSTDAPGYKNSVLSFWDISETRRKNYERNKDIVYKKE